MGQPSATGCCPSSFALDSRHDETRMTHPLARAALFVACCVASTALAPFHDARDRRVVDVVTAGDAASEASHGYVGHLATAGVEQQASVRRTTGWIRYALDAFDDSPVTVALVFAPGDSVSRAFDVVVEDSVVATRMLPAHMTTATVDISVPFAITKGRSSIAIVLRARHGVTPALRALRTVQDHNEL